MDLIGKTVEWAVDGRRFTAIVRRRDHTSGRYVAEVVDPGNFGEPMRPGYIAGNLAPEFLTVIDSEPVTEGEECE
jgi:hypothetical protein